MVKNYTIIAILCLIMLATLFYGISESGSPWDSRGKKFDQTRISDLTNLKYGIDAYYSNNSKLPGSLEDLKNSATYNPYKITDPENNQPYEYQTTSATSYQLCATFAQKSDTNKSNSPLDAINPNLISTHPKGHYCFELRVTAYPRALNPTPIPSPTPNLTGTPLASCKLNGSIASSSASVSKLAILGIYESSQSVLFTTNKIANASIEYWWEDPTKPSASYLYSSNLFDSATTAAALNKAMGYRIKVFDPTGDKVTSPDYIFQGNRTVIADARCK